jgi:hypothetical protein
MKKPIRRLANEVKLKEQQKKLSKLLDDGVHRVCNICDILRDQYDGVSDAELEVVMSDYLIYSDGLRDVIERAVARLERHK